MGLALELEQQTTFAGGQNDTAAATEYRPDEVRLLENARPSFQGSSARRRLGSRRLNAAAIDSGAACYLCREFKDAAGNKHLFGAWDDKFFSSSDGGATWTDRSGALTPTATWYTWAIMRVGTEHRIFVANGDSDLYYWTGTGDVQTVAGAPSGIKYLAVSNNRLWVAGHDGITVAASAYDDPDSFAAADGAFDVKAQTHDGDPEIRGLFAVGSMLLVFKRESTNYVVGFGVESVYVEAGPRGISRSVGCVGQRSIAPVGDVGVMWLSTRGIEYYVPGGRIHVVSRQSQNFVDQINWEALDADPLLPSALYFPAQHEYWIGLPVEGTNNTRIFVYRPADESREIERDAMWIQRSGDLGTGETLYVDADGYLAVGDDPNDATASIAGGYLEIDNAGVMTGFFSEIDGDGYLSLISADQWGRVLFPADTDTQLERPHQATDDGFVEEMETGNLDRVASNGAGGDAIQGRIKSRPFFWRDAIGEKQSRYVYVKAAGPADATVTVAVEVDGVRGADHALAYTLSSVSKPVVKRAKGAGGKGVEHVVVVEFTDDVLIEAIEIMAKRSRRR